MWQEFRTFLIKQNALALAIAVVIGNALNGVVDSLVKGVLMPIVGLASPDPSRFESIRWTIGALELRPGLVLNAVVNFLIVGFVAWRLTKLFIREAPAAAAKTVKTCPFCFMGDLDPKASRCPHCTSALAGPAPAPAAASLVPDRVG